MPLVYEYDVDGYVVSTEMSGESMDEMLGLLPTKLSIGTSLFTKWWITNKQGRNHDV